ncbi:MAG: sulfotransferase domain-containing protein [Pirellulales bacterium]|nr:sulfotransferase domain-containing protein [Pirellulales bacterium]
MAASDAQLPFRKTASGKLWKLVRQKYHRLRRELYQRALCRRSDTKRILFIVGCQRSGTTLIGNILAQDLRAAVLQEQSCITRGSSLRLRPHAEVQRLLHGLRAPLVVAKPIVESQWTPELLQHVAGSRALWMHRHYRDVVRSNVKRFASQVEGLRMAATGAPPSWRNERLSPATQEILRRHFHEDIRREDAAALGWYARNVLFFELGLDSRRDVMLCRYEELVSCPDAVLGRIYSFIELAPPRRRITGDVDTRSVGLGEQSQISPSIERLCEGLWQRFDSYYCRNWTGGAKAASCRTAVAPAGDCAITLETSAAP